MVLVDTSIWIALYRKKENPLGELMWSLVSKNEAAICGQVFVEFIGGFRNHTERHRFAASLKQFPFLEASLETFNLAAELLASFPRSGSGDVIIAATAIQAGIPLLTIDKGFETLTKAGLSLVKI